METREVIERVFGTTAEVRFLAKKEIWKAQEAWRDVFGQGYEQEAGKKIAAGKEWEALGRRGQRVLQGAKAVDAYRRIVPSGGVFVWMAHGPAFALHCVGAPPPIEAVQQLLEADPDLLDLVMLDENREWTMVFTSEWGVFEPLFAVAEEGHEES